MRRAAGEGYLTMDELDERITRAYAARYGHELDALVVDLPRAKGAVVAGLWTRLLLLVGRYGTGFARRRLVLAVTLGLAVVALVGAAVVDGLDLFDGGDDGSSDDASDPDDD